MGITSDCQRRRNTRAAKSAAVAIVQNIGRMHPSCLHSRNIVLLQVPRGSASTNRCVLICKADQQWQLLKGGESKVKLVMPELQPHGC